MKIVRMLALLGLAALPLAGCSSLQTAINAVKVAADATVPANIAIVAASTFDGIENAGADILKDCTPHSPPLSTQLPAALCASQRGNIAIMVKSIKAGRPIRDAIEPAPGQKLPVSKSAYDNLQKDITAITDAVKAFNDAKAGN